MREATKRLILEEIKKGYAFKVGDIAKVTHTDPRTVKEAIASGIDEKEIKLSGYYKDGSMSFEAYAPKYFIYFEDLKSVEIERDIVICRGTTKEYAYKRDTKEFSQVEKEMEVHFSRTGFEKVKDILENDLPFFE